MLRAPESLRIDIEQFEKRASEALSSQSAETCDAALSLYRGNLLLEDIYEEWSWGRREQLSLLHQNLLWKAARIYSKRGDQQASIDRLTELLAREPTHERAHRSLMKAYASIGHRDKALRQYQRCTESVGKELDAEPETATTELHRLIASGKFRTETTGETAFDPTHAHLQSLAVLPFVNNSADPELDYLCEGLAESLIKILSQLPSLRVMALSTVLRATGKAPNSTAIVATPARDDDSSFLISGTSCSACSSFSVSNVSTRSGLAPGK